jgi:hypothetical protein
MWEAGLLNIGNHCDLGLKMTDSQLQIAVAFVTEFTSLEVLALVPRGVLLLKACPLFLVAKSGQQDKWRYVADMKKGRQNQACSADPVHMICPEDILLCMYLGGSQPS